LSKSLDEYRRLMETGELQADWKRRGLLYVYQSRRAFEAYAQTDQLLRESFNEPSDRLDGDAVLQFEPALKSGLAGGWYYREDAHLQPEMLMASWRQALDRRDVAVKENCELRSIRTSGDKAAAIETSTGDIEAEAFVVATGALTKRLSGVLGCRIPIEVGKGYSLTMPRPEVCPDTPLIFPETRVAVTPFEDGFRLGSTMEFSGFDDSLSERRLQLLRDGATPFVREIPDTAGAERWYGWRPMTPDGLPIIDRSPKHANVWIAAGHNMLGVSMAPATGRLVCELVDEKPLSIDPRPYAVRRF
jgi:D-amino-acid dehydrogenase